MRIWLKSLKRVRHTGRYVRRRSVCSVPRVCSIAARDNGRSRSDVEKAYDGRRTRCNTPPPRFVCVKTEPSLAFLSRGSGARTGTFLGVPPHLPSGAFFFTSTTVVRERFTSKNRFWINDETLPTENMRWINYTLAAAYPSHDDDDGSCGRAVWNRPETFGSESPRRRIICLARHRGGFSFLFFLLRRFRFHVYIFGVHGNTRAHTYVHLYIYMIPFLAEGSEINIIRPGARTRWKRNGLWTED